VIALALGVRHTRLLAVANALDAAESGGQILIYTGPRPSLSEPLTDQVLLVATRLSKPSWTRVADGVLEFAAVGESLALRSGVPVWARLTDGDGRVVADVDAGAIGSGAELTIDPLPLYAGGAVRFALAQLAEP
jgi:hypothetical protein